MQNASLTGKLQSTGSANTSFWGGTVSNAGTLSLISGITYFNPNTTTTDNFVLSNTGLLQVADTASILTTGTVTLSGGGTILLQGPNSNIIGGSGPNSYLITDNAILGQGDIGSGGFKVINSGTISATTGLLTLQPFLSSDGIVNHGLLGAAGGTLAINAAVIANSNAVIRADANSVVSLNTSVTNGGTITTTGNGTVVLTAGGLQTLTQSGNLQVSSTSSSFFWGGTITNSGTVTFLGGSTTYFNPNTTGTASFFLTNTGLMHVANSASILTTGSVTLSGAGTFTLGGAGAQIGGGSGPQSSLINNSVVTGEGVVGTGGFKITNNGTISATSGILKIQPFSNASGLTNNGLLQANGGTLQLTGLGIDQHRRHCRGGSKFGRRHLQQHQRRNCPSTGERDGHAGRDRAECVTLGFGADLRHGHGDFLGREYRQCRHAEPAGGEHLFQFQLRKSGQPDL